MTTLRLGLLALIIAVSGCTSDDDRKPAAPPSFLSEVSPPADDWKQDGHGRGAAPDAGPYLVTWEVRVKEGEEAARCAEAADWLTEVGSDLPGDPVDESEEPPTFENVTFDCGFYYKRARRFPRSSSFGAWPPTKDDGFQLHPYLSFESNGPKEIFLAVSLLTTPEE